jgi:hypothetical protein
VFEKAAVLDGHDGLGDQWRNFLVGEQTAFGAPSRIKKAGR